jgi:predicted nucleic acid-binding protein
VRLILDCNVLISDGWKDGPVRRAFRLAVERHQPIISADILTEYETMMERPRFHKVRNDLVRLLGELIDLAEVVDSDPCPFDLPDLDDTIYLAAAITGDANAIITGNARHFPEPVYGSVKILSPRDFLDLSTE